MAFTGQGLSVNFKTTGGIGLYISLVVTLTSFFTLTTGQQQPPQTQNVCSSRFEAALAPQCFESYGVNFTGVIYVLSANRSGGIPPTYTYESFLEFLCSVSMQDNIIPCVLGQMQQFNSTQCTEQDRLGVLGRGGQLLAFMDAICGAPCEQEATQSMIQCYAAIDVNPDAILSPNASIADDKYTIVGTNETQYENFCNNRQKLFSCLSPLTATCPGLLERLYTIGVDLEAMEAATGLLCKDKAKFFEGLNCFTTPTSSVTQCRQSTETNMREVLVGRYQTGAVPPSKYMDKLCESKLTQVDCELQAFAQSCDPDISELRTSVECAILPRPCKDAPAFKQVYNGLCKKVTTPTPVTNRPTVPSGGPGKVPGTSDDNGSNRDDDDDDDDSSACAVAMSMSVVIVSVVLNVLW
ncbi:uncharacterized protein LOC106011842 [Aplysia californica]|uniref:Uncharacterized protein LOC106011842 n=1 Tax=Aplysia californica TaxID=6500 RepID=A0ABM1A0H7_APLCA|nr:uncharacterized protein LOC106011842 [Aplysia californica]